MTTIIVTLLIVGGIVSIGLNIAAYIAIKKLVSKIDKYEEAVGDYETWILKARQDVLNSYSEMKKIDQQGVFASHINEKGLFESDDFVGQIFKQLLGIVEDLNKKLNDEKTQTP